MGRLISGKRLPEVVSGLVIFRQENASLKAVKFTVRILKWSFVLFYLIRRILPELYDQIGLDLNIKKAPK